MSAGVMRGIAAAVMAAGAMIAATSCVGLFELDGYTGVAPELCDLLRTCYGEDFYADCLSRVADRLRDTDESTRASYLQAFADDRCLESCTSARRCLDAPPLCDGDGISCGQDEQCCGFLVGLAACGSQGCCASDGAECTGDAQCCNGVCEGGFCGGVACLPPGDPCTDDFECCTDICLRGECSENTCLPDGSECTASAECCRGFCPDGFCREPECKPEGQPCDRPEECCGGLCVPTEEGTESGVCSFGDCLPSNAACDPDPGAFPCCSGTCDAEFRRCAGDCAGVGESCATNPCCGGAECSDNDVCSCRPTGFPCTDPMDCCAGVCSPDLVCEGNTVCIKGGQSCMGVTPCCSQRCEDQLCCATTQCHDGCVTGPPLEPACGSNGDAITTCILQVCQNRPSCCCQNWTQDCVDEYDDCAACPVPLPQ